MKREERVEEVRKTSEKVSYEQARKKSAPGLMDRLEDSKEHFLQLFFAAHHLPSEGPQLCYLLVAFLFFFVFFCLFAVISL